MKEWVFLPLQKYKELVDCTKRTNDIITGFIKSKNSNPDEVTQRPIKDTRKRVKAAPKSPKAKKSKREPDQRPATPERPPTPDQSSSNSDSEESTAF